MHLRRQPSRGYGHLLFEIAFMIFGTNAVINTRRVEARFSADEKILNIWMKKSTKAKKLLVPMVLMFIHFLFSHFSSYVNVKS